MGVCRCPGSAKTMLKGTKAFEMLKKKTRTFRSKITVSEKRHGRKVLDSLLKTYEKESDYLDL